MPDTTDRPVVPPPPPPPPGYYAYQPAPPPRPGCFAAFLRLAGAFAFALVLVLIGFYAAFFSMRAGGGAVASTYRGGFGDRIAIIPIHGTITSAMVDHIRLVVDSVVEDGSIKAVVLRVDSPGGGASSSDQILHELGRIKQERALPIIASYGSYAASGGYYVSCQADKIFAEPTTVTGSIGVIAQVPTFQHLLEEKLGVVVESITATGSPEKETANTYFRHWTEKDRAAMRKLVDAVHERFVDVVYEGRQKAMTRERAAALSNGEVFTAAEAKESGLIDEIGYLDAALVEATKAGEFSTDKPPVIYYEPRVGLLDLLGADGPTAPDSTLGWGKVVDPATAQRWLSEMSVPRLMMLFNP